MFDIRGTNLKYTFGACYVHDLKFNEICKIRFGEMFSREWNMRFEGSTHYHMT